MMIKMRVMERKKTFLGNKIKENEKKVIDREGVWMTG